MCKYIFVGLTQYMFQELNFCSHEQCLNLAGMETSLCFMMAKLLIIYREAHACVYILCKRYVILLQKTVADISMTLDVVS